MLDVKAEYSDRISQRAVKCLRKCKVPERFKNLTNNAKKVDELKNEVVVSKNK
jgi:hypothetical protein